MALDDEANSALKSILAGGKPGAFESETLDFKREKPGSSEDTLKDLAEAAMCLANSQGGVLVVGVDDKASGSSALVGTSLPAIDVQRRVHQLSRPPLLVSAEDRTLGGQHLVFIFVPESPEIHSDPRGRATHRIRTDCEPMGAGDYERIREAKSGVDWSAKKSERQVTDAAPGALSAARSALSRLQDDRRQLATLSDKELLRALGVVHPESGRLSRAGELLFCVSAQRSPEPHVVYQYRSTPGGDPRDVQRLEAPLVGTVLRSVELINARRTLTPITLPNGQQLEVADFPEAAVREVLVNALVHRDHARRGSVIIEHSPEVLVITSPGPLVSGVTLANILTHPSRPRNPALTKAMRILGYAEEVGRGVDRVYREMIRAGRVPPRFEVAADQVRVTLVGGAPNTNVARFVATLPEEERDDTDTMLVLFHLCSHRTVRAEEIAPILQKTEAEAEATLRRLTSDRVALLEVTRQTIRSSNPTYRFRSEPLKALGQAVSYQRRTVDDTDRKVLAHLREYGKVTNRTVQNLLDVGMTRARDILRDLVNRELLIKDSEQERGPGVEYRPGPRMPAPSKRNKRSSEEGRQLPLKLERKKK